IDAERAKLRGALVIDVVNLILCNLRVIIGRSKLDTRNVRAYCRGKLLEDFVLGDQWCSGADQLDAAKCVVGGGVVTADQVVVIAIRGYCSAAGENAEDSGRGACATAIGTDVTVLDCIKCRAGVRALAGYPDSSSVRRRVGILDRQVARRPAVRI